MKYDNNRRAHRPASHRWLAGAAALALGVGLAACDTESLVELQDPDLITTPTVFDTANVDIVRNGVLYEMARAMAGVANNNQTPGYVGVSGYLADEMVHVSSWGSFRAIDGRDMTTNNAQVEDVYQWLHRARNLAEQTAQLYEMTDRADAAVNRAHMLALAGYGYVMLAEGWCDNVPYSQAPLGEPLVLQPGITSEAAFDTAIARFDQAIALAQGAGASASQYLNLARIGKARALQNLGQFGEAAAVADEVPETFRYDVNYSTAGSGQWNGFNWHVNLEARASPWTNEGSSVYTIDYFNMGPPATSGDPRVSVTPDDGASDLEGVPHFDQLKYPELGSDVPLATGVEAQLIVAEANLAMGTTPGSSAAGNWLAILNDLRAGLEGVPALADPGTSEERVRLLYRERAFWMWLTGHRLGDMRRLVDEYGFPVDNVYPIGVTVWDVPYGDDVVLPVPESERNNPLYDPDLCQLEEV